MFTKAIFLPEFIKFPFINLLPAKPIPRLKGVGVTRTIIIIVLMQGLTGG